MGGWVGDWYECAIYTMLKQALNVIVTISLSTDEDLELTTG